MNTMKVLWILGFIGTLLLIFSVNRKELDLFKLVSFLVGVILIMNPICYSIIIKPRKGE